MIYWLYSIVDRFGVWQPVFAARDDDECREQLQAAIKSDVSGHLKGAKVYCVARFDIVAKSDPVKNKHMTFVGNLEDIVVLKEGDAANG